MNKTKRFYKVTLGKLSHTTKKNSAQAAAREAFRVWIRSGELKRQPKSDNNGGFKGVEVELL